MPRSSKREPHQMPFPGMRASKSKRRERKGERMGPIRRSRLVLVTAPVTRRRFLSRTLGWVTAGIAAALGAPAVSAVVAPALRKEVSQWSPVGRLGDPEADEPDLSKTGVPLLTTFTSLLEDAYMKATPQNVPVFVINHGEGSFTILDVRCTHLGCPVAWDEKKEEFLSPCHGGVFDADGRVLAGPPPRPLDRYEFKVEGGVLYAGALFQVDEDLERVT